MVDFWGFEIFCTLGIANRKTYMIYDILKAFLYHKIREIEAFMIFYGAGCIPNGLILLFGVFLRGRMYPKWFVFLIWDTFLIRIVSQSCYFKDLGCF